MTMWMDPEPGGQYAKWDETDTERQIPYDLTYMWNIKKSNSQNQRVVSRVWGK